MKLVSMAASYWHCSYRSCLQKFCASLGRWSDVPGKTGVTSSGLIGECSAIPAVGECEQQKHNHRYDRHTCAPADTHSFLRLGMEIESAWRFDLLVGGIIVCVHGLISVF